VVVVFANMVILLRFILISLFLTDTNQKYLDTIYNSLSKNIKDSKYGVLLEGMIDTEN
jgi:hypothetical protein